MAPDRRWDGTPSAPRGGAETPPVRRSFCQRSRPPVSAVIQDCDQHHVHQLAVDELLERQRDERAQLSPGRAGRRHAAQHRLHAPARRARPPSVLSAGPKTQAVEQRTTSIGRGQQRRPATMNSARNGRPTRPKRPAAPRRPGRAAVLPHRLHGAVAPAVALAPQLADGRRGLGPGAGVLGRRRPASRRGAAPSSTSVSSASVSSLMPPMRSAARSGGRRRSRRGRSACSAEHVVHAGGRG